MAQVETQPDTFYAWCGSSLLVVDTFGESGAREGFSGYFFREARFLRRLQLDVDGTRPWRAEVAATDPSGLSFTFVHPERDRFGGGGTAQSDEAISANDHGIPYRALDLRLDYRVRPATLEIRLAVANRAPRRIEAVVTWHLDADFADVQEAFSGVREQDGNVATASQDGTLVFSYQHPALPYRTRIEPSGDAAWCAADNSIAARIALDSQQTTELLLVVRPVDVDQELDEQAIALREVHLARWREGLARLSVPGNRVAEMIVARNVRDFTSFPLLEGSEDEWLAMQAGMPLYPALFGRDALTAGWHAAFLDRGTALDASLTRLGRLQGVRTFDWRDEEPGRIPQQVRQGPLARLNLNPFGAYYGDFASPLMFVISLANLYAWTGERASLDRHWDTARRILDWARDHGDRDGDGYLEYLTKSATGPKNQGWKDSGDAIIYDDGKPVPSPIATCELQGYWYAAQQLMAVMCWAKGARDDAKSYWHAAAELKARFNRDWWDDTQSCVALAMDPDKRLVRAVTSNAGHCLATGIVNAEHLPPLVGRLFAGDMFSGWGIRTLSSEHRGYSPLSYHRGSIWAVENATIAFGLRRFGFDARALDIAQGLFDLAALYPEFRIPECVGGYPRTERETPGAYPRANTPQLWNVTAFPLLMQTILGLQPVAPLDLLVIDPVLPSWLPEITVHDLRLAGATATLRFWRDDHGRSHGEVVHRRGTLHLVRQQPPESLRADLGDRFGALFDRVLHH
jgi:glycogen debranching enzyme